jgi:hypothetical protein
MFLSLLSFVLSVKVLYSSQTRLVTKSSRCQLTLLTLFAFGVAWSRDWTMTSKLRVVEFGVGSLELLYIGRFNGVDPCQQALTEDSFLSPVTRGGGLTYILQGG